MKTGTKSILYGVHAFYLHPWFVARAWWKLYGFPCKPWLWVMFFVHDLGYWGKPNMDGPEGEQHPWFGAHVMYTLQRVWVLLRQSVFYRRRLKTLPDVRWWQVRRRWFQAYLLADETEQLWGNVSLYHSRFLSKKYGTRPSKLCIADKLAIALTPWWLYLPMAIATGEIREYVKLASDRRPDERCGLIATEDALAETDAFWPRWYLYRLWYRDLEKYMREWVEEHRDGREDTWTPDARESLGDTGVWR